MSCRRRDRALDTATKVRLFTEGVGGVVREQYALEFRFVMALERPEDVAAAAAALARICRGEDDYARPILPLSTLNARPCRTSTADCAASGGASVSRLPSLTEW